MKEGAVREPYQEKRNNRGSQRKSDLAGDDRLQERENAIGEGYIAREGSDCERLQETSNQDKPAPTRSKAAAPKPKPEGPDFCTAMENYGGERGKSSGELKRRKKPKAESGDKAKSADKPNSGRTVKETQAS